MTDYTVSVGGDFRELLAGFAKLEQDAQKYGQVVGQRIDEGVKKFSTTSLAGLQAELNRLQQRQLTVGVNTKAFEVLSQRIADINGQLRAVEQKRVSINTDPNSLNALNSKLRDFQEELGRVQIGSSRFKELQTEIDKTRQVLAKAGESTDGFRLLDGVVQGVAFSLSNSVVNGASQAIQALQGLISGYAQLDTVIRQAAAASGGPGDYDKLASTIDQVGIDAAGTTEQVAGLSLELARGGMTADQQAQSLSGIVRGAEATATAYDRMGQIVSATLTGFGLDASQTTRVVDALVQGANASATDVSGLGEAFKLSAPAAKLLGVSVEGLATAVGLFTNAGISASEAGTTLRNGLSQLAQAVPKNGQQLQGLTGQAKEAAETVKRLGLDIYTSTGQLKPMEEVLLQLKRAMNGMTAGEKTQLASKLFGGLDDAAKWLAVLGQSEEKIKTMATSMANSAGATDRNRDAMQGFQLTMQQLTGTLDSLSKNVGKVAAGALLPLVQAANGVVGAVSGLPGPVKDAAIALGLLTGGIAAATTAWVVFQRVIQTSAVQSAVAEVTSLAIGIGSTLKAGLSAAIAAWPAFIAQIRLASTAQFGLIASLQAVAAAIKVQFIAAMEGAKAAIVSFIGYLRSVSFAQFIAGARAAITALAPMAAAIAALTGAVLIWRQTLAGSDEVQQKFTGSQEETKAASEKLKKVLGEVGVKFDEAKQSADNARNGFVTFWNSLREPMAMRELTIQVLQFQSGWLKATQAALLYNKALREQGAQNLTGSKATSGLAYAEVLDTAANAARKRATALREFADAAEAAGRFGESASASQKADQLEKEADGYASVRSQLVARLDEVEREIALTPEQLQALEARRRAEENLNKVIREAPVRQLDQQIAVGQAMLGITKAMGEADQSRFSLAKAQLDLELKQAQARGAGEGELEAIRLRMAANDRAALSVRYQSLLKEQELQRALLALEQQKATVKAESEVTEQKVQVERAQRELRKAIADQRFGPNSDQAAKAKFELDSAQKTLSYRQDELTLLGRTQPLERQSAAIQAQIARSALQAQAAQSGYRIAANGSMVAIDAVAQRQQRVAELAEVSRKVQREVGQQQLANAQALEGALSSIGALEQSRFSVIRSRLEFELQSSQDRFSKEEQAARDRGASEKELASLKKQGDQEAANIRKRIADQDRAALDAKYQQLQREQQLELVLLTIKQRQQEQEARRAVALQEIGLRQAQTELQRAQKSGNQAAINDATQLVAKQQILLQGEREKLGLTLQGQDIERAATLLKQGAATNAIRAEQAAKGSAVAQENSGGAAQAVLTINQAINGVLRNNATQAGQMGGGFNAAAIASSTMAVQMNIVAGSTNKAAGSAREFYSWLERASRLPSARWAGGGVEAGGEYRINELGQEAFLSAGRLSLIDAAPNSMWRAPSDGVVIPAGITSRIKATAAVAAGSHVAGVADLAIEVGKLREEVGNLARRDWSVHVQQRTGPTGSQVLRTLLS